jgi:cell pole-organizing protein PopZ
MESAVGMAGAETDFLEGEAWRTGQERPVDPAAAEACYERAASAGHVRAQAELGLLLFSGERQGEALPWIAKAAHAGEPRAQYLLGVTLHNGDIVTRDMDGAVEMLRSAADQGIGPAAAALDEITPGDGATAKTALVSRRAVGAIRKDLDRLPLPPGTIETLAREMLVPLLRERLEEMLPAAFARGVDRMLAGESIVR